MNRTVLWNRICTITRIKYHCLISIIHISSQLHIEWLHCTSHVLPEGSRECHSHSTEIWGRSELHPHCTKTGTYNGSTAWVFVAIFWL